MNRWQMTLVWAHLLWVLLLSGAAVGQAPLTTTTTIAASGSTGNYTLTGTVAGPGTSTVYPTGSLSFFDTTLGANSLGSATLEAPVYSQVLTQKASLSDGLAEKIADNDVVAGDFNGDGKMDLALANSRGVVEIFLGNGDGTFGAETKIVLPSINGTDNSNTLPRIASGDFNDDGKLDLVVTCATTDVCILIGNGNGTFQTATEAAAGAGGYPMGLIAADFNGDGKLDIVLAMSGNVIYFSPGTGTGTFGTETHQTTGTTYLAGIVSGDFNGDGHRDLIVLDGETSSGSIVGGAAWMYLGEGDGAFQTGRLLGDGGIRAAVGDFNEDGHLDIAFISGSSANVTVYLGNGAGGVTAPSSQPSAVGSYNFGDVASGDFNGDGKLDIVCVAPAGTSTEIALYLGTGTGTFAGTSYTLTGNGPIAIASADLNGDGTLDLVIPNYSVTTTSIVLDNVTATVTATLTGVDPKGGGMHNVGASFPAETNYMASMSGTVALVGTTIPTSLSLSPNPMSSNYGQQVSLSAILSPYSYETLSTNGEAVSFYGNGTLLGRANLSSGVATYQTTSLPSGADSLTASFATDGNFAASGASSSITVSKTAPTITWATPAPITYGTALSQTQLNASCGTGGSVVYTPAAGVILTAATQTLSVTCTPTDTTDYNTADATVSLVVNRASPTITLSAASTEVYGTPNTASVHVSCNTSCGSVDYKFDGGEWSTGALDSHGNFVAARPTSIDPVGTHTIQVLYLGDVNDNPATSNTIAYTITKATPTITWAGPVAITYGTTLSATQLNASSGGVAGIFVYSPAAGAILNAGTQTLSVTFTPADTADYNTATGAVSLVVNKATPTITLTLSSTAPAFGDTISATISVNCGNNCGAGSYIIDGSNTGNVPLSSGGKYVAGINLSSAGTHTVQAQVVGNSNYNSALTALQTVTVAKARPTISWANPAAITYGTTLSSTQLNASSGTTGSFVYTPAAGTVLNAGTQNLSVTFTPTDTSNYITTTATHSVAVSKASPTITWAPPTAITYGTPLSSTRLNASAGGLAGTFVYTPAAGALLGSGTRALSVTFTPTDTTDYSTATATVSLTVNQETPIITWTTPSAITYDTPLSSAQLNASSGISGTFEYSPIFGTVLASGIHTLLVTFTPTDLTDYSQTTATVPLTVTKSATVISVTSTPNPAIYGDQIEFRFVFSGTEIRPTGVATVTDGVTTLGTITIDGSGIATYRTSDLAAGAHVLTVTYMGDANYQ